MTTTMLFDIVEELEAREAEIEAAIIGGRMQIRIIGAALADIQDRKLYACRFPTFEAYAATWGLSPERARSIASGWKMANAAATQTRIEDMPLYLHEWFAHVVEDVGRPMEDLSPDERTEAASVARTIGNAKVRILVDSVEKHGATPEALAGLSAEEQTQKLRELNADVAHQFGEQDMADFLDRIRRKLKRFAEEIADDPAKLKYLPARVRLSDWIAACSPPEAAS